MSVSNYREYWEECIGHAANDCGLKLTPEQLDALAYAVEIAHENYGMAFYSPSWSERISDIEEEYKKKLKDKERELEQYQTNAETAIKRALCQRSDANVSIGEYGEVFRHGGRTDQIQ